MLLVADGERMIRTIARWLLAVFFVAAGINHFLNPGLYLSMMPPWLPQPELLNQISGAAEIAGGMGVLIPALRRWAAWGLIALLVAIFPANLHIAMNGWSGVDIAPWILWARLPVQLVFIAWVYFTCLSGPSRQR